MLVVTSKFETGVLLILGIGMTSLCYWLASTGSGPKTYILWFGVPFFGACCVQIAWQLLHKKAALEITSDGICVLTASQDLIPWESIASISIGKQSGQRFLCIWLHDEAAYIATLSLAGRALAKANEKLGFPALSLSFNGLTPGIDETYEYIQKIISRRRVA